MSNCYCPECREREAAWKAAEPTQDGIYREPTPVVSPTIERLTVQITERSACFGRVQAVLLKAMRDHTEQPEVVVAIATLAMEVTTAILGKEMT